MHTRRMTQARVARGHSTADRESTGSTVAVPTHEKIVACYLPQIVTIIESERGEATIVAPLLLGYAGKEKYNEVN